MNQKELKELIEFLIEKDIAEFELERGDVKVRIKRAAETHAAAPLETRYVHVAPPVPAPPVEHAAAPPISSLAPPPPAPQVAEETGLHEVKSPIVGTFYESPSPGAPPFVKVGDAVQEGQVLCIIEAMKLMNEIEADVSGEIVKRLVSNAQPVEYGQVLFLIRPQS
ncbi:MAG TPA: acetyl-CoA carboxylase biotin carboxyl carrier protein [Terriglobales bacterium]|jgi:acetyl-CoA carboxylase biotin carboxyl carrier protein|nr:acetyl-CoA carboxylase biotin carboxyl carrier protein [Terriglobales bacterium]